MTLDDKENTKFSSEGMLEKTKVKWREVCPSAHLIVISD